ncbi:MAG: YrbL family protein [Nitratireductor sp.]
MIIKLSKNTYVAEGRHREIHLHPSENNLVVKIRRQKANSASHKPFKRLMYKWIPSTLYRGFLNEIKLELKTKILESTTGIKSPIAATQGLINTNLGLGMLMQRIGPKQKVIGKTLQDFADAKTLTPEKIKALNETAHALFEFKIVCSDLNSCNFVWSDIEERFLLVDGFGDRNLFKVRTLFTVLRNKKLNEGLTKTGAASGLVWSTTQRQFTRA